MLVVAACGHGVPDCPAGGAVGLDWEAPSCESEPQLCGIVPRSIVHEPRLDRAIDLVFVPEGFDDDEISEFADHVDELIGNLEDDEGGIVAQAPRSFNYHWLALPGTSLHGCYADPFLDVDRARAVFAAQANVPDVDVVIVVVAGTGRERGSLGVRPGVITIGWDTDEMTLTHELGHALIGLGDEYVEHDGCYPDRPLDNATSPDDLPDIPNLSFDPSGAKWASLVHGACEGGDRYACGVYHPTGDCRMLNSQSDDFCPVCMDAIRREIVRRTTGGNDGPPTCILGTRDGQLTGKIYDRDTPVRYTLRANGAELASYSSIDPSALVFTSAHGDIQLECEDAQGLVSTARLQLP